MGLRFSDVKDDFVGNIGLVGSGGSGKTRALHEVEKTLHSQPLFPYDEEAEMLGTTTVIDHMIKKDGMKFRIWDNPGQDNFDIVRVGISQAMGYKGLILFLDGSCNVYDFVAFSHACAIRPYIESEILPVIIIQNKIDLQELVRRDSKRIAAILTEETSKLQGGQHIPHIERLTRQMSFFALEVIEQPEAMYTSFSMMEQALANAFDIYALEKFASEEEASKSGFTEMNRRLITRAMLVGLCNDIVSRQIGDFIPMLKRISDETVVASNYHRPTARETGTSERIWGGAQEAMVPIRLGGSADSVPFFDAEYTEQLLQGVLGTEKKFRSYLNDLQKPLRVNNMELCGSARVSVVSTSGVSELVGCIDKLIERIQQPRYASDLEAVAQELASDGYFDLDGF
jgi:signal recognition particle receptor subunit beta